MHDIFSKSTQKRNKKKTWLQHHICLNISTSHWKAHLSTAQKVPGGFIFVISVFNGTVLHESCFNVYHQSLDTLQSIKRHSGFRGLWNSSLNVSYLSISHMVPSVNVIILAAVALIWQCTCLIKAGDTSWVRTLLPSAELGRLRQAARRNERRSHGVFARKIHATLWNHRWIMD